MFTLIVSVLSQDQEEPEGDVEGENGTSADEASPNAERSSPRRNSEDQSSPITEQIPPLDNSDTVDNESTTKLLNEESDWALSVVEPNGYFCELQ